MVKRRLYLALAILLSCALIMGALAWRRQHLRIQREENITRMAALGLILLDDEEGLFVLAVTDGSHADRAGIQPGDRLLTADNIALTSVAQLESMLLENTRGSFSIELTRTQGQTLMLHLPLR